LALTLSRAEPQTASRVVMLTSAQASEGKTLTITNLALTFSESFNQKVLLIDADLRSPMTHHTLAVQPLSDPNAYGVRVGPNETTLGMTLCQANPNLSLYAWLDPPPPDPIRALSLPHMERLVAWARTEFAWILIDSPPALAPEARILSQYADGVLFVVSTGTTPFEAARRAIDNVGRQRILGVVMNRAPRTGVDSALKYYQHAYSRRRKAELDS
jgi:Mrp family chromosome partitioning ATPase